MPLTSHLGLQSLGIASQSLGIASPSLGVVHWGCQALLSPGQGGHSGAVPPSVICPVSRSPELVVGGSHLLSIPICPPTLHLHLHNRSSSSTSELRTSCCTIVVTGMRMRMCVPHAGAAQVRTAQALVMCNHRRHM